MNSLSVFVLILILFVQISLSNTDFYAVLNVRKTASQMQIKKSYRKLAKELHPDKNKDDPDASKKFQDLGAAYEILSDVEKRKLYDRCGEECLKKQRMMENSDPFSSIFGDFGFNFGNNDNTKKQILNGDNILMTIYVNLEELYTGSFIEIVHNKLVLMPAAGTRKCNCGEEMVTRNLGSGRFQMFQQTICDECPNVQFVNDERVVDIEIELGMVNGFQLHFIAEGEPHIDGEPGDLYVIIQQIPHYKFERYGNDLLTNVTISLQDALIGFQMEIIHLDGHKLIINRNEITWPGARIQILEEGMPNYDNNKLYGNMYITFDIIFPVIDLLENEKGEIRKILKQNSINTAYNGFGGMYTNKIL